MKPGQEPITIKAGLVMELHATPVAKKTYKSLDLNEDCALVSCILGSLNFAKHTEKYEAQSLG
jgi:hypothetical protein